MVKKKETINEPNDAAIVEESQPPNKGVIAAMIPLLAGVILMVVSAWAFTEFFLLKQITNKLEAAGLVLKDSSEEKTENAKPKPKKDDTENKSLGLFDKVIAGIELTEKETKEYDQVQKTKFKGPFETEEFHKRIMVNGESRYLLARFEIDIAQQSRAHREKLFRILTEKKSFINDEALTIVSNKSFKNDDELEAYKNTAKARLTGVIEKWVNNEELTFSVLAPRWTTD